MKATYWILLLALALPFAWSCKQKEVDSLKGENSKLLAETLKKDSTINLLFQAFNEIEENLEIIKSKQNIIAESSKDNPEVKTDARERINESMQLINDLMDKNKRKIAALNKKLKEANLKMVEFEQVVERMSRRIEEKDGEINALKDNLMKMNFKVEELNARIDTLSEETRIQERIIEGQTTELNTAYYVWGTRKELIDKGILTKTGFLGTQKKLVNDLNKEYFTRIDITKIREIDLNAKKAKILTTHPSASYKLEGTDKKVDRLQITDPASFWQVSKYLVIEVETL